MCFVLHQDFQIPSCITESGPTRNTRLVVWIRNTTIPLYAVRGTPSYTMDGYTNVTLDQFLY